MALIRPVGGATEIEQQAQAWVLRIASGSATTRDLHELKQWCAVSPDHAQAFARARRAWDDIGQAGQAFRQTRRQQRREPASGMQPGRRLLLRSALSAAGVAAAVSAVYPPLGLWPSLLDLNADYHTATGEQRRIVVAGKINVDLNTQSRLNVLALDGRNRIELVTGEAAIASHSGDGMLEVVADSGSVLMRAGEIEVRLLDGSACVTCLRGAVDVRHAGRIVALHGGEQVIYDRRSMAEVAAVDPGQAAAWREGVVVFRQTALTDAIAEINRYRPGRVVLLNQTLGQRRVSGKFQIARLDLVIGRIEEAFGASVRKLPGGVVLLS